VKRHAAIEWTKDFLCCLAFSARESAVVAALCRRSPKNKVLPGPQLMLTSADRFNEKDFP
jgi:hypothetical protein